MRSFVTLVFLIAPSFSLFAQYYLRGEVKDPQGKPIANVRITLASKGEYPFYPGSSGSFGLPTSKLVDTITFVAEGFEKVRVPVHATQFTSFVLKPLSARISVNNKAKLSSFTRNFFPATSNSFSVAAESYSSLIENDFVDARNYPETGFALHVDRASYSNVRRFINNKMKPPPDAVRIEEMLNYFNFRTQPPGEQQQLLRVNSQLTDCPWQAGNQLLFINLQAKKINLDKTPPANLVFLIDVSGSMDVDNRLPLLKNAFKLLVENLRPVDVVSIVTYGDEVAIRLTPTSGAEKQKIIAALEGLQPAGSTPGESAIRVAYKLAKSTAIKNGVNRVIIATDGDFNVGITLEKDLEELVSQQKESGIYLTCLGVGMGNYKDSRLEGLARRGNGNFAYLDTETEGEKVLVEEFAQTIYAVANNVFASVKFNPAAVKAYRLIGFDNKKDALADSSSQVEGGELGSGHSLLAVFEITPAKAAANVDLPLATLDVTYQYPGKKETNKSSFVLPANFVPFSKIDSNLRFASSVIMVGSILKQSALAKNVTWEMVKQTAVESSRSGDLLQAEFMRLVEAAELMYVRKPRKKLVFFK